jgi:hypothetical protein
MEKPGRRGEGGDSPAPVEDLPSQDEADKSSEEASERLDQLVADTKDAQEQVEKAD